MRAEIISVGTELLLGSILNTNAQYLSKALAHLGFSVFRQTTIGDNPERLLEAIDAGFKDNELLIFTGGLGPTEDDLTKETVFEYFKLTSVIHKESLDRIESMFIRNKWPMAESNRKQALFPKEAYILTNDNGTAPGCIIEKNGKIAIVLPGPPREMVPMFEDKVVPYISKFCDGTIVSDTLRVIGVGESSMEEMVKDLLKSTNPTVAPYAKFAECELRISAKAKDEATAREMILPVKNEVMKRLGDNVYGYDSDTIESVTASLIIAKKMTLSVAESCTGGMLSARFINFPGASAFFLNGIVSYSNESKVRELGVKQSTLDSYGAVSEETAREMAEGIARLTKSDIAISVTGIAGPDGGTAEKPVGLVYICVLIYGECIVKKCMFPRTRNVIRERTVLEAVDMLRRKLLP
jgi:nicotinamide-nucleotide amidase